MATLKSVKVNIPGQWRDLWLYKNRILLWGRRGEVCYIELDAAYKTIIKEFGIEIAALAQVLIFRNDWKVGEQLRMLLHIPGIEDAFTRIFNEIDQVEITLPDSLLRDNSSEQYEGPVLDTCIYADRIYLATPDGLLESYFNTKFPTRAYSLNQQTDFQIARLAARYSVLNASAEAHGLYFGRILIGDDGDSGKGFREIHFNKMADYSVAASYARNSLLNYTSEAVPSLFRAKVETGLPHANARFEDKLIVGYEKPRDLRSVAYRALREFSPADSSELSEVEPNEEMEILGNSNFHLLALWQNKLRVIDLKDFNDDELEVQPSLGYRTSHHKSVESDNILDTYSINGGFVIEMMDSIYLLNQAGSYLLFKGQAARVRTFPNSLRHKETVALVEEDSGSLIGHYIKEDVLF